MSNERQINQCTRAFSIWRVALVLMLIAIVMTKPILTVVLENSEDKIELSSIDSDQEEDQEDSEEEDSEEEDSEEKDKVEESQITTLLFGSLSFLSQIIDDDHYPKHSSDFRIGIVLPPPELV